MTSMNKVFNIKDLNVTSIIRAPYDDHARETIIMRETQATTRKQQWQENNDHTRENTRQLYFNTRKDNQHMRKTTSNNNHPIYDAWENMRMCDSK